MSSIRQVHLRFTPVSGKQPLFGESWRRAASVRLREAGLPLEQYQLLFHHDGQGRTKLTKAPFCFVTSASWVGVVATGPSACEVLKGATLPIILAAQSELGPVAADQHELSLRVSRGDGSSGGQFYGYEVRSFVGNAKDRDWTPVQVREKLVRALNAWAEDHGVMAAGEGHFRLADVMLEKMVRQPPAISTSQHAQGRVARERSKIQFYMPWKLDGMWFVGGQASKGHGLVRFARPTDSAEVSGDE